MVFRLFAQLAAALLAADGMALTLFLAHAQGGATPSAAAGPGSGTNTYSVQSSGYVTLATPSGVQSFVEFKVKVQPGPGAGAVTTATACGANVKKCVTGTVSGTGGSILVNVSDPGCKSDMAGCTKVCVGFRNGDSLCVDTPGFLTMALVQALDATNAEAPVPSVPNSGEVPAAPTSFRLAILAPADPMAVGPGGGSGGTTGSLPPQPSLVDYTGPVTVRLTIYTPGGATIAGPAELDVLALHGVALFEFDLTPYAAGSRVQFDTVAPMLDPCVSGYTIQ